MGVAGPRDPGLLQTRVISLPPFCGACTHFTEVSFAEVGPLMLNCTALTQIKTNYRLLTCLSSVELSPETDKKQTGDYSKVHRGGFDCSGGKKKSVTCARRAQKKGKKSPLVSGHASYSKQATKEKSSASEGG